MASSPAGAPRGPIAGGAATPPPPPAPPSADESSPSGVVVASEVTSFSSSFGLLPPPRPQAFFFGLGRTRGCPALAAGALRLGRLGEEGAGSGRDSSSEHEDPPDTGSLIPQAFSPTKPRLCRLPAPDARVVHARVPGSSESSTAPSRRRSPPPNLSVANCTPAQTWLAPKPLNCCFPSNSGCTPYFVLFIVMPCSFQNFINYNRAFRRRFRLFCCSGRTADLLPLL